MAFGQPLQQATGTLLPGSALVLCCGARPRVMTYWPGAFTLSSRAVDKCLIIVQLEATQSWHWSLGNTKTKPSNPASSISIATRLHLGHTPRSQV